MTEIPHMIPRWARTISSLHESISRVRSQCLNCGMQQICETENLLRLYGGISLIDKKHRCTVVGCLGLVFYMAATSYGRPWIELRTKPFEGSQAPVATAVTLNLIGSSKSESSDVKESV